MLNAAAGVTQKVTARALRAPRITLAAIRASGSLASSASLEVTAGVSGVTWGIAGVTLAVKDFDVPPNERDRLMAQQRG